MHFTIQYLNAYFPYDYICLNQLESLFNPIVQSPAQVIFYCFSHNVFMSVFPTVLPTSKNMQLEGLAKLNCHIYAHEGVKDTM